MGVVERGFDHLDVNFFAAGRLVFLNRFKEFAGFHDAAVILLILASKFSRKEIKVRFADDFVESFTQRAAELWVGERETFL